MEQAVRMVDALDLAEAAHAGVERRHLRGPLPRIGADLDDAAVADVGVDDAPPAAVVAARAGDDRLARPRGHPRRLVHGAGDRARSHGVAYDSITGAPSVSREARDRHDQVQIPTQLVDLPHVARDE